MHIDIKDSDLSRKLQGDCFHSSDSRLGESSRGLRCSSLSLVVHFPIRKLFFCSRVSEQTQQYVHATEDREIDIRWQPAYLGAGFFLCDSPAVSSPQRRRCRIPAAASRQSSLFQPHAHETGTE
jgi:hypothetical protein